MHENIMELMWSTGHLSGSNAEYVEELYEDYLTDPESVPKQWCTFFDSLASAVMENTDPDVSHAGIRRDFKALSKVSRYAPVLSNEAVVNSDHENKQVHVLQLISSYRVRGHQKAKLDPLGIMHRERCLISSSNFMISRRSIFPPSSRPDRCSSASRRQR